MKKNTDGEENEGSNVFPANDDVRDAFSYSLPDETPRTVFHDEKYQRVCARVGSSTVLCLTVRYPFPVTPKSENESNYDRHVDKRFNGNLTSAILDGDDIKPYETLKASDDVIQAVLDKMVEREESNVVAVFTRRMGREEDFRFFGTKSDTQRQNIKLHFEPGHKIIVYGDSNAPSVGGCMLGLFDSCNPAPKFEMTGLLRMYCWHSHKQGNRALGFIPMEGNLDQDKIFVTAVGFENLQTDADYFLKLAKSMREMLIPQKGKICQ